MLLGPSNGPAPHNLKHKNCVVTLLRDTIALSQSAEKIIRARRFLVTNCVSSGCLLANRVNPLRRSLGIYSLWSLCVWVWAFGGWQKLVLAGLQDQMCQWQPGAAALSRPWVFGQSQQMQIWHRFSREPWLSRFGNHTSRLNLICLNRQLVSQQELV